MVAGKRSRGGQRKRWHDNIKDWLQLDLNHLNQATQNELWKELSHVSAHSAAGGDSVI